jgi:hypothetical protein
MVLLITLTAAGADTGPFNLFSNVDGFTAAFETGVSKAALLAGYTTLLAPAGTTVVRVKSAGTCTNQINITVLPCSSTTTTTSSSTSSTTSTSSTSTTTTSTTTSFVVNLSVCFDQVAGGQATVTVSTDSPVNTNLSVGVKIYDDLGNDFADTVTILSGASSGTSSIINLTNGGASATSVEITSVSPSSSGGYSYVILGSPGGCCSC